MGAKASRTENAAPRFQDRNMSDTLSNLLSRLRNAQRNRIPSIGCNCPLLKKGGGNAPARLWRGVLNVLQENGYIRGYRLNSAGAQKGAASFPVPPKGARTQAHITILLKYKNQKPAIRNLIGISKPSRRVYICVDQLAWYAAPPRRMGQGIKKNLTPSMPGGHSASGPPLMILATSKGILSSTLAAKLGLGGEILCQVQ